MDEISQNPWDEENQEQAIFSAALEQPSDKRASFVKGACRGDDQLLQRVEALLEANDNPESMLGDLTADATHESPFHDESVGQTLGRYKLLERVGEGGYGVVYVAEQTEPVRRRVALKVIKLGMDTKQVVARFEAERQALALMDHPNIAKVLDAGTTEQGRPYFVMELVRGIKITDYCDQEKMNTKDRLDLFIKVCHAIQHAHQKGIIHRDIKPSNILVTLHDGVPIPKVIDFGIAKATEGRLTDATVYTQLHQFIGTPAYMSPEQAEMSGLDIDTRSDIYSLGVLLYELLIGKTPFDGKELVSMGIDAMRKTIRESEPARPSTRLVTLLGEELTSTATRRSSEISTLTHLLKGDLDWIVMKCLEKDRQRRYETANALAADIKRHLGNEPIVARPPSAIYKFQKAWRRNKILYSSGALVALSLVLGVIGTSLGLIQADRERKEAVQAQKEQERLREVADEEHIAADKAKELAIHRELGAKRNAYAADIKAVQQYIQTGNLGTARRLLEDHIPDEDQEELRGWEWRYFHEQAKGDQIYVFEGHSNTVKKVQFSPDNRRLVSLGYESGEIILWNWIGQKRDKIKKFPIKIEDFEISKDGDAIGILFDPEDGTGPLEIWDAELKKKVHVFSDKKITSFRFSPLDDRIFLTDVTDDTRERVISWNPLTKENHVLIEAAPSKITGIKDLSEDGRLLIQQGESYLVWDLVEQRVIKQFDLDQELPSTVVRLLPPPGVSVLLGSYDRQPMFLNCDSMIPDGSLMNEFGVAVENQFAISPEHKLIVTGSYNHNVNQWNLNNSQEVAEFFGHGSEVWSVDISPDGRFIASGGQDKNILLWNTSHETENGHFQNKYSAAVPVFSPDGTSVALATQDDFQVQILNLETGTEPVSFSYSGIPLQYNSDGSVLIVLTDDSIIHFDSLSGIPKKEFMLNFNLIPVGNKHQTARVICSNRLGVFWSKGNNPKESEFHVIDLYDGGSKFVLPSPSSSNSRQAFNISKDGQKMAVVNELLNGKRVIEIWDLELQERILEIHTQHTRLISYLEFSPDGMSVASWSLDSTIGLWELESGKQLHRLEGHKRGATGGSFSPDGMTLVSVNSDRSMKLWNIHTGREVASFNLPSAALFAAFSPDGRFLIAYGNDLKGCRIWQAPTMEQILQDSL